MLVITPLTEARLPRGRQPQGIKCQSTEGVCASV